MNQPIPEKLKHSKALKFIIEQGWNWKEASGDQIQVEVCPYCKHSDYKLYFATGDPNDPQNTRDGLHYCHAGSCGKTGNLRTLAEYLGLRIAGVDSRKEWAGNATGDKPDALPDVEACHAALLGDPEALDYLLNVRGFTQEIIDQQKLGLREKVWFREAGDSKALVIPYLVGGNVVFAKYRTLPPKPKDFVSPSGWEAPLYNGEILQEGINEILFVEGEADALSCMSHGIPYVVGVPGANVKKALWIETLDKIAPNKIYILYDNDKAGKKGAQELASRIGIEKCYKIVLPHFVVGNFDGSEPHPGKDINEWFRYGSGTLEKFEELKRQAGLFDVTGVTSSKDALTQLEDELNGRTDLAPTYVFQWPEINKLIGLEDGDVLDIVAPEKVGKGGRITTPVLLPNNTWKQMGQLKVGEAIASVDGQPNFVTGVFPRGKMEMFKVTFWDGRSTDTTADHLWKVAGATPWERKEWRVYTTDAIANEYCYAGSRRKQQVYVPLVSGDFGENNDLPIDPWLLGVLLGDGSMTGGTITFASADEQIVSRVTDTVKRYGGEVKFISKCSYRINGAARLRDTLKRINVYGHTAESKFIPKMYLSASKYHRWELLRGLMDTDGTAGNKQGTPSYCTVSKQLANDVVYLVRSLGGIAKVSAPQKKCFTYKGEYRTGQPAYIIVVRVSDPTQVFSLQRKLLHIKPRRHQARLTIKSIEPAGVDSAVCISVSHPSSLYITDDYIVTHNTTMGMNIMDHMVGQYGEDGLIVCLEMTQARLARKWVALVTGFEDILTEPGTSESKAKLEELKAACVTARSVQQSRGADLYFAYPLQWQDDPDSVFKLIKDCIRRYGVKWVMFDNLQKFCDESLKSQGHRTIYLSQLSKKFASIAKDYKIKLIRILQPKRIEKGATISTNDVDGSSQVAKDCDGMITLWRSVVGELKKSEWETQQEGFQECNESFEPVMKVTVGLSRYSGGGSRKLFYDGARSQVRSLTDEKKASMKPKENFNGIITEAGQSIAVQTETETTNSVPTEIAI